MQRHFTLVPSFQLLIMLLLLHSAAALTVVTIIVTFGGWSMLLLICLLISLVFYLLRDARLSLGNSCVAMRIEEDRIVLITRAGIHQSGILLRHSVVTPFLVIINVAIADQLLTRSIVLFQDSMDEVSFRRLRVALRWGDLPIKNFTS